MIGARVCSRIAARSSYGSDDPRVACRRTWRWPPASAADPSATLSLDPTNSSSGCDASAARSVSEPSHDPVM